MLLLGIDPGQRTGICAINYEDLGARDWWWEDLPGSVDGFLAFATSRSPFSMRFADEWIIEDFTTREGKHGVSDDASRVIGAALALAHVWGVKTVLRPPSGRKKQVPDYVLHNLFGEDAFVGNKDRNIKEAVRHTVGYMKSLGNKQVLEAFNDKAPDA